MVARKPPFILAKCLCLSGLEACPVAFALLKTPPHPLPKCAFGPFLGWQNEGYVRPLWSRISVWRDGSGKPRPTTSSADRHGLPGTARIPDRGGCVLVGDGIEPADHCGGRIGLASARSHRAIACRNGCRAGVNSGCGGASRTARGSAWNSAKVHFIGPVAIDENSLCQSYHLHRQPSAHAPKGSVIRPTITMVCRVR